MQINRTEQDHDGTPNSEMRTADVANDYDATIKAFKGCDAIIHLAAIPDPVDKDDSKVHNNNVNSAFNGLHAAGELGIHKVCYASSVNAIGLAYSNRPLKFDCFPIDEETTQRPTDSYALAKDEAELQAQSFVHWFPGMNIACMRIHQVAPRKEAKQEQEEQWEARGVRQLWGWVNPSAVARICLMSVEKSDKVNGCEVFNVAAPTTTQSTPSEELAKKYFPDVEIRGGLSENQSFWTCEKAERILGWTHHETE